jgi:hypothetical protein
VITSGDEESLFVLTPPAGAACPGDTRNDGWFVSSFLVPLSTEIDGLGWGMDFPLGEGNRAMRTDAGSLYGADVTQENPVAGSPGIIKPGPAVTFGQWPEGFEVEPGQYRVGIACTYLGVAERYWDAEVVVTSAGSEPTDIEWSLVGSIRNGTVAGSDSNSPALPLAVGGIAVVVAAIAFRARARRRTESTKGVVSDV